MNKTGIVAALAVVAGFYFVSMFMWDWKVDLISLPSLPFVGSIPLWSVSPFQLLEPYMLFIGAFLALMVAYVLREKNKRGK